MQITVELAPELQARLAAEAQARGVALESYIAVKLGAPEPRTPARQQAIEQAIDDIRTLRKGNSLGGISIKELIDEGRKY